MILPNELWICKEPTNGKWRICTSKEEAENLFESYRPIVYFSKAPTIDWDKVWLNYESDEGVYALDLREEKAIQELVELSLKGKL